jgi:aspartate oxidase
MAPPTVAVVGTGLAGLSAAYELSIALQTELPEARVVVFEKNKFLGGNSMKASSGINAVNPAAEDTEAIYAEDTRKSGGGLSKEDLVAQLVVGCNCCCCSSAVAAVPRTALGCKRTSAACTSYMSIPAVVMRSLSRRFSMRAA